jgi:alanine racemase
VSEPVNFNLFPDAYFISVNDTVEALQVLVCKHRQQFSYPVIGITGSNGKTIVKEWLYHLLQNDFKIIRSPKSYNSQIGAPLSIWQMDSSFDIGIFEAGISLPGEMENLERMIKPDVGVFTNIGEAHNEGFINLHQKIREKLKLFVHASALVYCRDNALLHDEIIDFRNNLLKEKQGKLQLFDWSRNADASLRIMSIEKKGNMSVIHGRYKEEETSITIPFTDDASVENAITCWSVLCCMGLASESTRKRTTNLLPVAMRLEMNQGINRCTIINDSYSADLSSLNIALDFLQHQQQHSRKTVILSDILESGKPEKELYQLVALSLKQKTVNRLIGIGQSISHYQKAFSEAGLETEFFPTTESFLEHYHPISFKDESILLKGARVFEFERINQLLEQKIHQTVLEINLSAVTHNLKEYQRKIHPETKIMAMVKAFSYGSGSFEIANLLQFHKVDYLAVAYADEGIELRKSGISLPIMVMNAEENVFPALTAYDLQPEIYSFDILQSFDSFLKSEAVTEFPIHIKLDTGMHRLGFESRDLDHLGLAIKNTDSFKVQTIFSHLVASEDPNEDEYTMKQAEEFTNACRKLEEKLGYSFIRHIANTAAIIRHPHLQLDMVRLGIGLYGINSAAGNMLSLKEVSTLKTTVAQLKKVKAGETVGYNRKGVLKQDSSVATIRIGYADGYPRRLGNGNGKVLIRGRLAPVIGNVCMDMTMIDVTGIPETAVGDDVILFGKDLPVTQLASWAETIPYELMTGVSQRVKRVYFEE